MNKSYYEPIVKYHENMSTEELKKLALQLRRDVADLINFAGTRSGHVGGEFSIADVMAALYGRYLRLTQFRGTVCGACVPWNYQQRHTFQ